MNTKAAKVTNIFDFASSTISLITDPTLREVYKTVTKYMDSVEALGTLSGSEKLKWVLAKLPEVIADFLRLKDKIILFIEKIKAAYNQVKSLIA